MSLKVTEYPFGDTVVFILSGSVQEFRDIEDWIAENELHVARMINYKDFVGKVYRFDSVSDATKFKLTWL